ncbi:MAG TPA: endonuclease Q family protein, partial [Candidatus Saccharimonadales bacterium]|nr:endonuclease Q family protein [Candidatus Saccharimonadales bacterium]
HHWKIIYMKFIADFHIHSKYSHATSKFMDLITLSTWSYLKGIGVMGSGDFTHPIWQQDLKTQLQEVEPGLFELKSEYQKLVAPHVYESCKVHALSPHRFILTSEISTVFKRNGRCYRTHSIILAPSFQAVDSITKDLEKIGNIKSDGRPILGCDVRDIVKIALEASEQCMVIPAHIWTPWYGLLGSKSGFNSVHEAFGDLTQYIYALEKGLSSNFLMNAQLSELDRFAILCNSDAHSLQNLGREANVLNTDLSYTGITNALRKNNKSELLAGIEFFPERGKYYGDGHRACGVYLTPQQTAELKGICPVCHRPVTVGVLHRVNQLADRTIEQAQQFAAKRYRVVPLLDIVAQELKQADSSLKVQKIYHQLLQQVGPEFYILLKAPIADIQQASTLGIAEFICRVRSGHIIVQPGYDGVYGKVQ